MVNNKQWIDGVNEWMEKLNPDVRMINESINNAEEECKNRKEEFRKLHQKASSINEDVMKRFYNIESNHNKPVRIDEVTLDRVLKKHGDNGMINISANRSDATQEENDANTKSLINDLKNSGYSYLPTYGGYRGTDGVEDDYEPSFVVFNYGVDGKPRDFKELEKFAIEMCNKFHQDCVLIKAPGKDPIYVNSGGGEG